MGEPKEGKTQIDLINIISVFSLAALGAVMPLQWTGPDNSVLPMFYGISFVCFVQIFLKEQLYRKTVFVCLGLFCLWMWVSAYIAGQSLNDLFFNGLACQWYVCTEEKA